MFKKIKTQKNIQVELLIIAALSIIVFVISGFFDALEQIVQVTRAYEELELDELIIVGLFLVIALSVFSIRRWNEEIRLSRKLEASNESIQKALSEIKQLESLLPICASCKQIRDDKDIWHTFESYISKKTDTQFTHSICPSCAQKLYPDLYLTEAKENVS